MGCKGFLYGTIVREPLALMDSTGQYNNFNVENVTRWLQQATGQEPRPLHGPADCKSNLCRKHHSEQHLKCGVAWQFFDNFVTRSFNGLEGWRLPPGGVNTSHVEHATRVISGLDVVMDLATLTADLSQLEQVLGWRLDPPGPVNITGSEKGFMSKVRASGRDTMTLETIDILPVELFEFLRNLNRFDSALYGTSSLNAKRKTAAASAALSLPAH